MDHRPYLEGEAPSRIARRLATFLQTLRAIRGRTVRALAACTMALAALLGTHFAAAQTLVPPEHGTWWNKDEPGRGFFIDFTQYPGPSTEADNVVAMAGFLYDGAGKPVWFISSGKLVNNTLTADMQTYRGGQTLAGAYTAPEAGPSLGTLTLHFTSATTATLVWPGGTEAITRFGIGPNGAVVPAPADSLVKTGIFWNRGESGRAFTVEQQGDTLLVSGYMYDADGSPVWYISAVPTHRDAQAPGVDIRQTQFTGNWQQYGNGHALGAPFTPAQLTNGNVAAFTFNFFSFSGIRDYSLIMPDQHELRLTPFF